MILLLLILSYVAPKSRGGIQFCSALKKVTGPHVTVYSYVLMDSQPSRKLGTAFLEVGGGSGCVQNQSYRVPTSCNFVAILVDTGRPEFISRGIKLASCSYSSFLIRFFPRTPAPFYF